MEAVEVSPPYDISDITALVAVRAMVGVLATMTKHGRIGGRLAEDVADAPPRRKKPRSVTGALAFQGAALSACGGN